MLFNSFEFVILVAVTLLLYYLPIARTWQVVILIVSSFVFYGSHEPWLLLLLIASVTINAVTVGWWSEAIPVTSGFGL